MMGAGAFMSVLFDREKGEGCGGGPSEVRLKKADAWMPRDGRNGVFLIWF